MAVKPFDETAMVLDVSLPWKESTPRQRSDWHATGLLLGGYCASGALIARSVFGWGKAIELNIGLGLLVIIIFFTFLYYGPVGGIGHIISVDDTGMWIHHRGWKILGRRIELSVPKHLPAHEIGEIKIATEKYWLAFDLKATNMNYEGHKIGWTRVNTHIDATLAIMIHQTRPGLRRPWWLYRCEEAHELATALTLARNSAQADQ